MSAYGSFPRSLLLPEGGRCGTFLVALARALCTSCILARMRLDQEGFKAFYLTGTLSPKHSINQHGKEGSKEGRSWGPSPKEGDYYLGKRGYAVLRSCWHACLLSFLFAHRNIFPDKTLWMQPSGLAPLPDRSRNKILREIFHSLCWRPQTSPARVDSSNPEERFNICWTSLKSWKRVLNLAGGYFSLLSKTPPAFWAEQIFLLEI